VLTSEHSQLIGSGEGNGDGESGPEEGCGDGEGSSEADGEGIDGNTSKVGLQLTALASRHHSVSACTPHTSSQLPAVGTSATTPPVSGPWYCSPRWSLHPSSANTRWSRCAPLPRWTVTEYSRRRPREQPVAMSSVPSMVSEAVSV